MEWTSVAKVHHAFLPKVDGQNDEQFNYNFFFSQDAKIARPEVNLMSLLSSFDDVSLLQPEEEETDTDKDREEAPKLPRTNSLEDLGIKVLPSDCT